MIRPRAERNEGLPDGGADAVLPPGKALRASLGAERTQAGRHALRHVAMTWGIPQPADDELIEPFTHRSNLDPLLEPAGVDWVSDLFDDAPEVLDLEPRESPPLRGAGRADLQVLGSGHRWDPDECVLYTSAGAPLDIPEGDREVLAELAKAKGRMVTLGDLVNRLGGSQHAAGGTIARLRKLIPGQVQANGSGYRLDLHPDSLDGPRIQKGRLICFEQQRVVECGGQHVALEPDQYVWLGELLGHKECEHVFEHELTDRTGRCPAKVDFERLAEKVNFAMKLVRHRQRSGMTWTYRFRK